MATRLPVRVLLVDDSPIFLETFASFIESQPDLVLAGTAANGKEALDRVARVEPDLVVMDVMMPVMDGLQAVEEIMSSNPTPILLCTGEPSRQGAHWTFEALERGALELMPKSVLTDWSGTAEIEGLVEHLKLLASVPVVYRRRPKGRPTPFSGPRLRRSGIDSRRMRGVGIVASTGGPAVLAEVLEALPPSFPLPILVVQHLAEGFAPRMASWLDGLSPLNVLIAADGDRPEPGTVYVAPDGAHMFLDEKGLISLDCNGPPLDGHLPSGTRLLSSLARVWGELAVGAVLTGMGEDGAAGLLEIRKAGGACMAQDEESSVVFGMARVARELGAVEAFVSRSEIAAALVQVSGVSDREAAD
ncbi:MAG: chemotaxis-specific protein-glutamate methyltransferase CheB [Myxococcota bacterium]